MTEAEKGYDLIIIGAGPAGLTSGIYAARSGLKTLILEEKFAGGMMAEAPYVENYPAFQDGISGLELANRMEAQARNLGVKINIPERVIELKLNEEIKTVKTDKKDYETKTVLIASGCEYKRLGVEGEEKFRGRGVSYCATCDGFFFKNRKVLVVGGGNSAAASAIYLSSLASNVRLVHRRDVLRADNFCIKELYNKKVELLMNKVVREVVGETTVKGVILEDIKTGKKKIVDTDGIFVHIGEDPRSRIAKDASVKTNKEGYIIVDGRQRTNLKGVYAAGDVTNCPVKQIGTAVGQAIIATVDAYEYIKRPYYCEYAE